MNTDGEETPPKPDKPYKMVYYEMVEPGTLVRADLLPPPPDGSVRTHHCGMFIREPRLTAEERTRMLEEHVKRNMEAPHVRPDRLEEVD